MLEEILEHLSPWRVLILALVLIPTYAVFRRLNEDRRIRALGARTARAPARLPLGMISLATLDCLEDLLLMRDFRY